jgi:hypothetical protein
LKRKPKTVRPSTHAIDGRVLRKKVAGATPPSRIAAVASRLPVLRRFAPPPPPPKPKKKSRVRQVLGVPGRVIGRLRGKSEPPPPPARSIPFVSPVVRRMRQPLASTARMVQVAREARKPKTAWSRMREAAALLIEGDGVSTRMERVAGLAIAASAPKSTRGLRARLFGSPNENAGAGKPRAGARKRNARRD